VAIAQSPGGSAPSAGSTGDVVAVMEGAPAVVDEGGRAWPASEIARALCDCALTRAVVDAAGLPLDLGRGQRLFQRQHWIALLAAGITTCVWPDCTMPLRNTGLHHLSWWDRDGGRTDLANCGPYCRFHHGWVHDHDIAVTRVPDGRFEHRDRRGRLIGVGGPPAGGGAATGGLPDVGVRQLPGADPDAAGGPAGLPLSRTG
jgi:hypothetical protein